MKHLIILADGSADWHNEELGGKTLYQYANTPNIDRLARDGRTGMLKTVQDGFHPGSEVANSAILGYDQEEVYEGRGPLEAASIGVELKPTDMAIRCNIICIEGDNIKNHSAGHLATEEGDVLIQALEKELGGVHEVGGKVLDVHFYTGVQYRHLLVIGGGDKHIACTPPHDVPGQPWRPLMVKAETPEAQPTADLINELILRSQTILSQHPLNLQRQAEGHDPANSIWPWAGGNCPRYTPLTVTYPQIKRGAVITAVDLIRGIGHYAGLRCIDVPGATGLFNTNYEGKAEAALAALETDDFVYLHIEAPDEAGHDGKMELKIQTIEDIDSKVVGPILSALYDAPDSRQRFSDEVAVAILPDHPTPVHHRTHTNEPIPFAVYAPGIQADAVQTFDEDACQDGACGSLEKNQFIDLFMGL